MRNFIGNLLIIFAAFLSFTRNILFFGLTVGFIGGILIITMTGLFELFSPEINFFGKWYWDLIVVILGGATMWLGFQKMFENDKKTRNNKTKNKKYLY
jgi:hypothetical protein